MKKHLLLAAALCLSILMNSCLKHPDYNERNIPDENAQFFDFATTQDYRLKVDYNIDYMVDFAVYEQYPYDDETVTINGQTTTVRLLNTELKPIFHAITDKNGSFNDIINLPTAVKKVWIHTKYIGIPEVIETDVTAAGITLDLSDDVRSRAVSRADYSGVPAGIKILGKWDILGVPDYLSATPADVPARLFHNLMYSFPNGINIDESKYLGKQTNIVLTQKTPVDLVFIHDGGGFTNAIGYYAYPTANEAAIKESDIQKILAFPNTSYSYDGGNLTSGDQVRLKYWNPTTQQFEDEFPAGTTIGFFFCAHGFSAGNVGTGLGMFYSNYVWNTSLPSAIRQQTLLLKDPSTYSTATKDEIILTLEDTPRNANFSWRDTDFNDITTLIKANKGSIDPNNIPDITPDPDPDPQPDPNDNYFVREGTLAFEDLWPYKGDYDMNDVVIEYTCTVMMDINNNVVGMVDSLRPRWSGAEFFNAFGYQLDNINFSADAGVIDVQVRTNYPESRFPNGYFDLAANNLELGQDKAVIMLFENIKTMVPAYRDYITSGEKPLNNPQYYFTVITRFSSDKDYVNHPKRSEVGEPPYNPFIVVTDRLVSGQTKEYRRKREIHLPNYAPTKKAISYGLAEWFGYGQDMSAPSRNLYYVSNQDYPWAINIPIIFNFPKESEKIDIAYPHFSTWVESKGIQDEDWYNHPAN